MRRRVPIVILIALFITGLAGWDFLRFCESASGLKRPAAPKADAVVALTGGSGLRIAAGIRLVEAGAAPRLLVSGVHPNVSLTDIAALAGGSSTVYDCCVELGHTAKTTLGNADETAEWVANNGYRRLIVVTSDYHLPRSLILLRDAMPRTELVGYPVRTAINPEQPFKTLRAFRGLASEWLKWRVTGLRDRRR